MKTDTPSPTDTPQSPQVPPAGPLQGLRVLDLTRVLAGPGATMMLGDMGADVIKIEKPGSGDDTRHWGPPFVKDSAGHDTSESAYYLCANRNKRSVAIDIATPEGQALVKQLLAQCDILVENYKTGGLDKYGLGYHQLKAAFPRLIYCSLTGFGHTGPYQSRPGYDFMIQAMGGIMSLTGDPDGPPQKMAVAYADVLTGMYALSGILAALYHREKTGAGQFIDIALLDAQVAALWNVGQSHLLSGQPARRWGNAHASIVPYQAFAARDGWLVLAVGNDRQFRDFCRVAGCASLAEDVRFLHNEDRVAHRHALIPLLEEIFTTRDCADWVSTLEQAGVPCGPVNTLEQVFADPQTQVRGATVDMAHPFSPVPVKLLANPLKFSDTPVTYRHAPPPLGQHTYDVLHTLLNLSEKETDTLRTAGVIA